MQCDGTRRDKPCELTDSAADLPYKLAWEATECSQCKGKGYLVAERGYTCGICHGIGKPPNGPYDVFRVGDCEVCGVHGVDLKCTLCQGNGGRYEAQSTKE